MSNVLDRLTNEELKHNTDKIDVQIQAEGIKELEEFSKGTFNFTSLIPIPQPLLMTCGPLVDLALFAYFVEDKKRSENSSTDNSSEQNSLAQSLTEDELIFLDSLLIKDYRELDKRYKEHLEKYNNDATRLVDLGEQYFNNCLHYKCLAHHSWCQKYWGTPLNALNVKVLNDEVSFSTVNGKPLPILKALSIRYPHMRFKCRILTDDGNYDYIFENGEVIKED